MKLQFTYRATTDMHRLRAFIASDDPLTACRKIDSLRRATKLSARPPASS